MAVTEVEASRQFNSMGGVSRTDEASGGPASFVRCYREQGAAVWKLVQRLGVDERDLDDVTHDVFVVAHRRWSDFDPSRPCLPWLVGIAYRVVSDWKRSARVRHEVLESAPSRDETSPDAEHNGIEEAVNVAASRRLVLRALDALPPERRAVFVLHELEEHTMPEIAEMLAVPLNTLYSRLRIGRSEFGARVRQLKAEEEAA